MRNDSNIIHETSLGHIIDIWDTIKALSDEEISKKAKSNPMSSSSIAKASSNLTMVFPVLCSRNISIATSSMVSKALEKNIVSMLQRLFASWQFTDDESIETVKDYISKFHGNISTRAASLDDVFRLQDKLLESACNDHNLITALKIAVKEDIKNINYYLPDSINESSLSRFIYLENEKKVKGNNTSDSSASYRIAKVKDNSDKRKMDAEYFNKQVPDADFKKANELMPTSMVINFTVGTKDGPITVENGLAAVKAKLYPLESNDIVTHLSDKLIDRNWITNFFRASTREISFMKDFVLALDKAKIDALSLSDRKKTTDRMWKVLERRALTSRLKRAMRRPDSASVAAITTLVISQEEVEYMRKHSNIDMESVSAAMNLFETLNLMCICIVDESLEVAKFIYDEQEPMWETISFTHLEREASDNTYKKVVNLMTKISK